MACIISFTLGCVLGGVFGFMVCAVISAGDL